MDTRKIIAVDFDGTLCENKYPEIGAPNRSLINILKTLQGLNQVYVVLWTCRTGDKLQEAVEWCESHGLLFDAVNENLPHIVEQFGGDTRKVFADLYIEDKCFNAGYEVVYDTYEEDEELKEYFIRCATNQIMCDIVGMLELEDIRKIWNMKWC